MWDLVLPLAAVLPDAEEFAVEVNRELNDDATGIQVSIFGGDLTLTAQLGICRRCAEAIRPPAYVAAVVGVTTR
jgi:hypothetical protein